MEMKPKCFKPDNTHDPEFLTPILYKDMGWNVTANVMWCKECGAVVVDGESDGRVSPGRYVAMRFPKIAAGT